MQYDLRAAAGHLPSGYVNAQRSLEGAARDLGLGRVRVLHAMPNSQYVDRLIGHPIRNVVPERPKVDVPIVLEQRRESVRNLRNPLRYRIEKQAVEPIICSGASSA